METAEEVTKAVTVLHNFLLHRENGERNSCYCPPDLIDQEANGILQRGEWRRGTESQGLTDTLFFFISIW